MPRYAKEIAENFYLLSAAASWPAMGYAMDADGRMDISW